MLANPFRKNHVPTAVDICAKYAPRKRTFGNVNGAATSIVDSAGQQIVAILAIFGFVPNAPQTARFRVS
jgi:hypothetical protein